MNKKKNSDVTPVLSFAKQSYGARREDSAEQSEAYLENKGSLVIEALLAVVILSTSLSLILQSLISSLRANVYSVDYTQALILLESKMNEALMKGKIPEGSTEEGNFPEPHERYSYSLKSASLSNEDEQNLDQLILTISWNTKKKKNNISLETYLFKEEENQEGSQSHEFDQTWVYTR